jgi:hypothetical protein
MSRSRQPTDGNAVTKVVYKAKQAAEALVRFHRFGSCSLWQATGRLKLRIHLAGISLIIPRYGWTVIKV